MSVFNIEKYKNLKLKLFATYGDTDKLTIKSELNQKHTIRRDESPPKTSHIM